jgi:hypothetical protein
VTSVEDQTYEIRVAELLDDRWSDWFEELTIAHSPDATCTLTGPVTDQSQLHGILARLRDIGATLISVRTIDSDDECGSATPDQT